MSQRNLSNYFRPAPHSLRIGVEINRGAYGTVHEGELDDKPVAVKKIHRLLLEAASSERVAWTTVIRNFERECRLLEALRHPYIVGFMGAFYEMNLKEPILVMERMRENLRDLLGREKQLSLHRQLQICFEIVAGLEFLHSRSPPTVHRDLNDKNVMLSEEGVMKIGDLGQSRLKEESVDYFSTGQPGAIPFMPPEALRDKAHYNEKIDMFSLGVLMLEIATGRYPSVKLIGIGIESEIVRRREDLSKLSNDHPLQHFVLQCLKDNYRDRPSATAIRSFVESEMQSKDRGRSNRGNQGPHPRVIEIEVEKVELSKSENPWKRATEVLAKLSKEEKETSELYRKFRGILNKLTPQKFQKLAEQAKELAEKWGTQERMSGCIEMLHSKAVYEQMYSVAYAKLSLVLTPYKVQVTGEDGQLRIKSFRVLLLIRCQQEFEKDKKEDEDLEKLKAAIEAAKSEDDKKVRKDEYDAAEFKSRHRSLGHIKFIGELFKFKLLSEAIIHECIQRLLKSTSDGESLECFVKLMTTIGKELDHDKGQNLMDRYFGRVDYIIEANKIGLRVKFLLQDVVDLRKNAWVPRKIVASNVPTTIDKLHADHHQQAEEMKRILSVQPSRPRQPPGDSRRRDDYSSDGRRGVQQLHAPEKLETDRLRRLDNRPLGETGTKRLGPSTWSKQQTQQPQSRSEPQKVESTQYDGRSSKGKKTAGPAPSGSRRSATQLIATEAKKQQKDVIAAVALQTGYNVQPTPVVSDALSEEDVEKKSESLYVELCSNLDYKEALLCISEMRSPGKLHRLVFTVLNVCMEKTSKCRHTAGVLFDRLVKEGHLSSESLLKGLNELLEFSEDLECDLPKFWDYIAEVLAPPVVGGGLPLADLKQTHDHVLQSGKMGKLVAKTLQQCTTLEQISQDHVSRIWSESGLDWTSDLRVEPSDVKYLVEDHSLQFLSHSSPPAIQVHSDVSHDKQQEWIHRLQHKLSSFEDRNEDIVSFIEKHHSEHCHSPLFIYSLSCALVNAGVSGSGDSVVYKSDLLERRCPVLKHFVDHHSNLQIDIIYGLQVTLSKKQHPKGILDKLFTLLYEQDVIGEYTFILWEEEGREDLEGRGVALMSAKPFMEWLRSIVGQDGQ